MKKKSPRQLKDEIEIARSWFVMLEKEVCKRRGHDYNFVTNVDRDREDKDLCHRCGIDGPYQASENLITRALEAGSIWSL